MIRQGGCVIWSTALRSRYTLSPWLTSPYLTWLANLRYSTFRISSHHGCVSLSNFRVKPDWLSGLCLRFMKNSTWWAGLHASAYIPNERTTVSLTSRGAWCKHWTERYVCFLFGFPTYNTFSSGSWGAHTGLCFPAYMEQHPEDITRTSCSIVKLSTSTPLISSRLLIFFNT